MRAPDRIHGYWKVQLISNRNIRSMGKVQLKEKRSIRSMGKVQLASGWYTTIAKKVVIHYLTKSC